MHLTMIRSIAIIAHSKRIDRGVRLSGSQLRVSRILLLVVFGFRICYSMLQWYSLTVPISSCCNIPKPLCQWLIIKACHVSPKPDQNTISCSDSFGRWSFIAGERSLMNNRPLSSSIRLQRTENPYTRELRSLYRSNKVCGCILTKEEGCPVFRRLYQPATT